MFYVTLNLIVLKLLH